MSAIDTQNAKQIRDPMDVLITLDLADDTVTCTFSDYGSAKVGDGRLNVPTWPMRKLADLQGEGFPLNGEHVLYDPSTTPSARNGKLGVRSNVGQSVSVTVTGNKVMASLTLFATGAESVTFNGTTTPFTGSSIVIPVGATSITLTFNPANETERIVISEIQPGTLFRITNENLIKATVSLRSDLSIIDPTLPESEINIEVYQDTDISEAVATIPEDTPITYRAGYPGDMSPERKFYVTGQVTWADNVLTIQGVDAVHFFDVDIPPLKLNDEMSSMGVSTIDAFGYAIAMWGNNIIGTDALERPWNKINDVYRFNGWDAPPANEYMVVPRGVTLRNFVAFANNVIRYRNVPAVYGNYDQNFDYVLNYIDAGIPTLREGDGQLYKIKEEDAADVKRTIEKFPGELLANTTRAWIQDRVMSTLYIGTVIGTAEWIKGVGITLDFNGDAYGGAVGIPAAEVPTTVPFAILPLAPMYTDGSSDFAWPTLSKDSPFRYGPLHDDYGYIPRALVDNETTNNQVGNDLDGIWQKVYASFIPWGARYDNSYGFYNWSTMAATWRGLVSHGIINRDANSWKCDIYGYAVQYESVRTSITLTEGRGGTQEIEVPIKGRAFFTEKNDDFVNPVEAFPQMALETLADRSPVTGSFTWKGDPRMQPRDLIEWERLDGSTEVLTAENITLTHEGGGTIAEITYRKGVV